MLGIIKGDVRYTYLSQMIEDSILSDKLMDFYNIDALVLPFGGISSDYTIHQTDLNLMDILKVNRIRTIYVGNANTELKELCAKQQIQLYEILKDFDFVSENAFLTAKGLLYFIHRTEEELKDLKVWILGYGYIGYYLAKLCRLFQVDFSIYTENPLERKYVQLEGYRFCDTVEDQDIILNTIPKVLDLDYFKLKGKRIVDVASAPYGFDMDKIMQYQIAYEIIPAIPSKYAPKSAARIVKKFIETHR